MIAQNISLASFELITGHHTRVYITYTKSDQKMANELRVWLVQNRFLVAMDNHDLQERDNVRRRFEKVSQLLFSFFTCFLILTSSVLYRCDTC